MNGEKKDLDLFFLKLQALEGDAKELKDIIFLGTNVSKSLVSELTYLTTTVGDLQKGQDRHDRAISKMVAEIIDIKTQDRKARSQIFILLILLAILLSLLLLSRVMDVTFLKEVIRFIL